MRSISTNGGFYKIRREVRGKRVRGHNQFREERAIGERIAEGETQLGGKED